jgi:hypothetical protein
VALTAVTRFQMSSVVSINGTGDRGVNHEHSVAVFRDRSLARGRKERTGGRLGWGREGSWPG